MAVNVQLKRSAVPNKVPTTENLQLGELAINTHDGKLFFKVSNDNGESIVTLSEVTSQITEDNLAIDTSSLSNSNSSFLSGVLADFDIAITNASGTGGIVDIDGGFANSVYLAEQLIDGGSANGE